MTDSREKLAQQLVDEVFAGRDFAMLPSVVAKLKSDLAAAIVRLPAAVDAEAMADEITRQVAELPDRTSPDDRPDMMTVNHEELQAIVTRVLAAAIVRLPAATPLNFIKAIDIAHRGFDGWAAKEHNRKWFRKIDGTPIPNDVTVCIASAFVDALSTQKGGDSDTRSSQTEAPGPDNTMPAPGSTLERAVLPAAADTREMQEPDTLRSAMLRAYLGIIVLRAILKRAGLKRGREAADDTLKHMAEAMPELPGLSTLRQKETP